MDPASGQVTCLTCARMGYLDVGTSPADSFTPPEVASFAPSEGDSVPPPEVASFTPPEGDSFTPPEVASFTPPGAESVPPPGPETVVSGPVVGSEPARWDPPIEPPAPGEVDGSGGSTPSPPPPARWDPPEAGGPPPVHPGDVAITGPLPAPPPVVQTPTPQPMSWSERRSSGFVLPKLGIEPASLAERTAYRASTEPDPLAGASPAQIDIARTLASARSRGVEVLSRRWVAEQGDSIDHLVVAPNGLWIIHAEPTPTGRVERRDDGDWFDSEPSLVVGEEDRTRTVQKVRGQVEIMRAWLASGPYDGVPVIGVICFVDAPGGWFSQPFEVGGVNVMLRHQLIEPMLTSILLAPAAQDDLLNHLAISFRAAS